ncbi:hypothetical protein CPC08DRAFT_665557, partial [Agrocybe pediades]
GHSIGLCPTSPREPDIFRLPQNPRENKKPIQFYSFSQVFRQFFCFQVTEKHRLPEVLSSFNAHDEFQ